MVRPPGPEGARHPPPDHRRGNGSGALVPLGRPPLPPGGRARARRRHRRREPRADRRSGRTGRAVTLASPRCGAPHRASSARACGRRAKGSGESSRIRAEAAEAAASRFASGPRPRSSEAAAPSRVSAEWSSRDGGSPRAIRVHGVSVTAAEVEQLIDWLASRTPEERRQVPGLNPERADIILAGLAVTAELLDRVRARSITVSAFGLREGLLLEMAGAKEMAAPDPLRLFREFAERCQCDRKHVEQVRTLALQLFDQLAEELGCDARGAPAARGGLAAARRRPARELSEAPQAQLRPAHARGAVGSSGARTRARGPHQPLSSTHRTTAETRGVRGAPAGGSGDRPSAERPASGGRRARSRPHRGGGKRGDGARRGTHSRSGSRRGWPGADLGLECWGASRKADVLAKLLKRDVVISSED